LTYVSENISGVPGSILGGGTSYF